MLGVFISFSSSNYWPEGLLTRWACSEWRGGKLELWVLYLIKNFCCLPSKVVVCLSSALGALPSGHGHFHIFSVLTTWSAMYLEDLLS